MSSEGQGPGGGVAGLGAPLTDVDIGGTLPTGFGTCGRFRALHCSSLKLQARSHLQALPLQLSPREGSFFLGGPLSSQMSDGACPAQQSGPVPCLHTGCM